MIIAIDIETGVWNNIISLLIQNEWMVMYKYDAFDAGIDYDLIMLEKDGERIFFGWDNWVEGEIKCTEARMKDIEQKMGCTFQKGEPINLKPGVIALYIKEKE
jgi:hypothetical protein